MKKLDIKRKEAVMSKEKTNYEEAIAKSLLELQLSNPNVICIGQGVTGEKAIFGTTKNLPNLLEFPICEESMTGFALGLALNGYIPILSHIRLDFLVSSMNQIVNMADKYRQMFGDQQKIPLIIRGIIGRSWGQGSQHSGGFYPIFCHFPNLNVYAPVTANDAYNVYQKAVKNKNPSIIIEHRKLYGSSLTKNHIIKNYYTGDMHYFQSKNFPALTLVGISRTVIECLKVIPYFEKKEILPIDLFYPLQLNPLNIDKIIESAKKTKKVLIVENSWLNCGLGAEIAARIGTDAKVERIGFHPSSCPASSQLEDKYHPDAKTIADKISKMYGCSYIEYLLEEEQVPTKGPF